MIRYRNRTSREISSQRYPATKLMTSKKPKNSAHPIETTPPKQFSSTEKAAPFRMGKRRIAAWSICSEQTPISNEKDSSLTTKARSPEATRRNTKQETERGNYFASLCNNSQPCNNRVRTLKGLFTPQINWKLKKWRSFHANHSRA